MDLPEQQETTTIETPAVGTPSPGMPTRDDLIAAVKAAGGTASVDVDAEAAAAGQPPPVVEPAEEDRLTVIMRRREAAHAETEKQRATVRQLEADAQQRAQRLIEDAEARARKIDEDADAALRAKFARSPAEALRGLGDPQQIIDEVLRAGTPEAKAMAQMRAELATARADAKVGLSAKEDFDRFKAEQAQAQLQASTRAYHENFLATHASAEKAPYLHARFDPAQIVDQSVTLARSWAHDGLKYQVDFDDADVVAYLEKQSKDRVAKLVPTTPAAPQVSAAAPLKAPGNAPKVQANGPRTLSAAQGSERRTSPKPLHEMNAAQKRAALVEAAAEARRNNPDDY